MATDFFNQSQFKIDQNTGAAKVTYPIAIPPGRNGVQPNLDLVYNSQNTQLGGIFGEGWSIGIPYVERFNRTGVDAFYSSSSPEYFASSIDGELSTTTTSGSYIARTDAGAFNKYTFSSNEWTMVDKNGTQYLFGSSTSSQQSDPGNASDTYKWMLTEETDANGNSVQYNYFDDSGQIYPSSTVYTNTSSTTGVFEVDFLRATSTDNATSSFTGFPVHSNYRVSEIDAKVNGTWVRKYALAYATGDNGSTTLLSSIAESGENASGTIVEMPTSTFSYQTQTAGWVSNSVWDPLISFTASSSADDGVRVADVNGDGLPDIVQGYSDSNGSTTYAAYINNGADWTVSSTWNPPIAFVSSTVDMGVRIADVNGDGLPDILQGYSDSGGSHFAAYINTGDGWTASSTWNPPLVFVSSTVDVGVRIADVNGDGLPDLIQAYSDSGGGTHYAAYINNGSGWTSDSAWDSPALFIATSSIDIGARFADVNGDGLPDIIQGYTDASSTSHYAAYLNTGNGFSASSTSSWNPPVVFANNGADSGARVMDVNGDGLPDIVQAYTDSGSVDHYAAYLNNGNGWTSDSLWNPPVSFTLNGTDNGTRIVDVNGDGLPDIIQAYMDASGVEHTSAYVNNNKFRADLLTSVTYPQGGKSTLSYQSILQITDPLGNVLNGVPYPVYIISQVGYNDDFGNAASSTYVYQGGTYYTNGPFDHQFAGFTQVTKTDPAGNVTKTYYDTSKGNSSSTGQYQDNFWKIGEPYRVENYDNSANLYRVLVNRWDSSSLGGEAGFVKLASTTQLDYDVLSTHADKAEWYTYDNTTGNLTEKVQWGQVVASSDGTFTDTSTDKLVTDYSYASSVGSNVTGKVSDETLTNQSSTKIQETRYYYDGLGLGSIGAGNLTKQEDWKSGTTYITTAQNTYNGYGLVTETLDPRGKATDYSYDSYNLYPATSTNALSQAMGYTYDYSTGQVAQTTDPNRSIFKTAYDGFGRTLEVTQPDPSATSTQQIKTGYAYTDTPGATSVHRSDYLSGSAGAVELYDTSLFSDSNLADYYRFEGNSNDAKGTNNGTDSNISYSASYGKFGEGASFNGSNSTIITGSNSGVSGSAARSISLWFYCSTTTADTALAGYGNYQVGGAGWTLFANISAAGAGALGVNVAGPGSVYTSAGAFSNNTWNHVVITYSGGSLSTGVKIYLNGVSQTLSVSNDTTPNTQNTPIYVGVAHANSNFGYYQGYLDDVAFFNRVLTSDEVSSLYSGGPGLSVDTYTYYDGLGRTIQTRVSSETSTIYKATDESYNSLGLVQKKSLPYFSDGTSRTAATSTSALFTTYTYDPLQRPLTETNAVGDTSYSYANWKTTVTDARGKPKDEYDDAYGNLARLDEHNSGNTYSTYYAYDGLNDLTKLTDALGNVRNFTYDGLGRELTAQDLHAATDTTFGTWDYSYDDAGNLTQKVNPNSQTITYAYDDLNRVTSESEGGQTQISYTYDTCTYGVGRLCVASSSEAVTSKTYDALGQLAQESKTIASSTYTTSYTYDRQGHQLTITNPDSSKITYTYNTAGLAESVSEQESGGSLTTIVSDFNYSPTDQVAQEVYANGTIAKNIYDPLHLYRLVGKVTANGSGGGGQLRPLFGGGFGGPLTPGGSGGLITTSTETFSATSTVTSFTVPSDVYNLAITLDGAQGAASSSNRAVGGKGGQVSFSVGVASGTTFWYYLGAQGNNGVGAGQMSWFAPTSTFATSTVWAIAGGGGAGGMKVVPGGCGSTDGGAGGGGGGTSGSTGSSGTSNGYGHASGGGGGTQSAGGAAGAGGTGFNNNNGGSGTAATSTNGAPGGGGYSCSGDGGGGGSGYFGGGGGGGGGGGSLSSDNQGGGGGGGGSSFILATSTFSNTSTVAGVNVGNGSLTIVETHQVYAPTVSSLGQFLNDATTTLSRGSSTSQTSVVLGAMLNSSGTENLQLQLEAEPIGKNFTGIPNVTSSAFMAPNTFATSSFYGASGVGYHWQARAVDALGNPSDWLRFSSSTYTTDFTFKYNYVIATSTYTGAVGTYTVPDGVTKLIVTVDGAQGGSSGGLGGEASGTLPVTPGATYFYNVGQKGGDGSNSNVNPNSGGGGGGMTWFSTQATFATSSVLLAGGGGGGAGGAWEASSGGTVSGGSGGYGGGGAGGSTNGTSPGAGGGGGGLYGGNGGTSTGGSGGTQSSGYALGQGGAGQSNVGVSGPGCAGGSGGGTSGANGSTCTNGSGWQGTGGGGGGSGYISATASLTATGTASGVHSGNGFITIEGLIAPTLTLSSSSQYYSNGTTTLPEGYSTNGGKVVFGGTLNSAGTSSVQMQVEVEPVGFVSTSSKELYDNSLYGDANLNSYYRLEGNSNDWKGSNNGYDHNIAYGANFGLFGKGASFNGGSSDIITGNNSGISGSAARSISLWFYCTTTTADTALAGYGNYQTGGAGWTLFANISAGGTGALGVNVAGPGSIYTSAGAFSNNQWNHVVITYSGGSLGSGVKIYLNGVSKSLSVSNNTTPSTQNTPIYISAAHANTDFGYYSGYLDDVAFFNRALSATEVQNLYNGTAGGFANLANTSSSALVSPGTFATSSFSGAIGSYHWQARVVDPTNNGVSSWQLFGPTATSTDFSLSPLLFTYPTPAATTSSTFNWQLNASNVTSTNSYKLQVGWGISAPNEASSSVNASGTQVESGVSLSKTLYSGDYSDAGDPVNMSALASLYDITGTSTLIATTSVSFTEQTIAAAANCAGTDIQCISYSYDANGNIISIVDNSTSSAARTVDYTYDDLNRLTNASSSNVVSGSNYSQTFSYDALGNMLTGPSGSYSYDGSQGTNYANPDAVTSITLGTSTTDFTYDNDGNLLSTGNATDTWNYRDQMTQTLTGSGSSTYAYDYTGARVKLRENATTTVFASNTYNVTLGASTTVKSIFANGALIATVEGASSTIYYDLTDHLGGLNLVEATSGAGVETLDYYPYGQARIDIKGGSYGGERRKYIGQEYDGASNLNYLQARYEDPARGQFLSVDPIFLALGNPNQLQKLGLTSQDMLLANPQLFNGYGYASDNPIVNRDPTGRYWEISGSIVIPGRSFSAGVQIDQYGVVGFFGGGLGFGGGGGIEVAWAPGQSVPHQRNAAISVNGEYADVLGGRISQNVSQYSPDRGGIVPVGDPSYGLVLGVGGGIGIQEQLSAPLPFLTWGHPQTMNSVQQTGQPQATNNLSKTYLSQGYSQQNYVGSQPSNSDGSLKQILTSLSGLVSQLSAVISSLGRK